MNEIARKFKEAFHSKEAEKTSSYDDRIQYAIDSALISNAEEPPFVMSKYATELDLYKDKARYYQKRCESLEKSVIELLGAVDDYVKYEHDGDPYSEDARQMNEMELDELNRSGKLDEIRKLLNS